MQDFHTMLNMGVVGLLGGQYDTREIGSKA